MSWVAVEPGVHILPDGATIEAGTTEADSNASAIGFTGSFDDVPVVLAQVASEVDETPVVDRITDVNATGFNVRLIEEEARQIDGVHDLESVHWIAFEQGVHASFSTTDALLDERRVEVPLQGGHDGALGGDAQTASGQDPFSLRLTAQSATSAAMFLQEDRTNDAETNHVLERVGLVRTDAVIVG